MPASTAPPEDPTRCTVSKLAPEASLGDTNASMRPSGESARWLASSWTGIANSSRSAGGICRLNRNTDTATPTSANTPKAIRMPVALRRAQGLSTPNFAASEIPLDSRIQLSSSFRSCALCGRSSGSFARHVLTMCSSSSGVIGCNSRIGRGSSFRIAAIKLAWLFASNAFFPVAISYSMAPNEKISLRASAFFPSICSGDMYCIVPTIIPCAVSARLTVGEEPISPCKISPPFARPKSSSLAPDFVSITFPGFRSRCTIP